jgi:hypothetical protein
MATLLLPAVESSITYSTPIDNGQLKLSPIAHFDGTHLNSANIDYDRSDNWQTYRPIISAEEYQDDEDVDTKKEEPQQSLITQQKNRLVKLFIPLLHKRRRI